MKGLSISFLFLTITMGSPPLMAQYSCQSVLGTTTPNWTLARCYEYSRSVSSLGFDPGRGYKVHAGSVLEAFAAVEAVRAGLLHGPLQRGPAEVEFIDGRGTMWDVKTPPSPSAGDPWTLDIPQAAQSIAKKVALPPTEVWILLDTSFLTRAHRRQLLSTLRSQLSFAEMERIVELKSWSADGRACLEMYAR